MKIDRRAFIKRMNGALAGMITMLGFASCEKESGAIYTVKGAVVNKETRKPIAGIRVGFNPNFWVRPAYGVTPTRYEPKAHVITNANGEFRLTDRYYVGESIKLPILVKDEKNGLFQSENLLVEFPIGVRTVTVDDVELTEIKNNV